MINWLWQQSLFLSALVLILVLFRNYWRRTVGAKGYYLLWAIIPTQLLLSLIQQTGQLSSSLMESHYLVMASDNLPLPAPHFLSHQSAFALIWWLGASLCATGIVVSHIRFRQRLHKDKQPLATGCLKALLDKKHTRGRLKITASAATQVPIVTGLMHHEVVLPPGFEHIDTLQQSLIMEHELVHIKRGDLLWNAIALALLCVFWFNPCSWWAYRHFRQAQEIACDAAVLNNKDLATRQTYASTFLSQSALAAGLSFNALHYSSKQNLTERIQQMRSPSAWHWFLLPTSALLLYLCLGFQALSHNTIDLNNAVLQIVSRVEPRYPLEAYEAQLEGVVTLQFSVETDGSVSDIEVLASDHHGLFDDSAVTALQQWTYRQPVTKQRNMRLKIAYELAEDA